MAYAPLKRPEVTARSEQGNRQRAKPSAPVTVQAKLTVGEPNDPLEREADRIAAEVASSGISSASDVGEERAPRKCATCDKKDQELVLRKVTPNTHSDSKGSPISKREIYALNGRPLPISIRKSMEKRIGHDFSSVLIHTGSDAARLARRIGAEGFTYQGRVIFGAGKFRPKSREGQALIAHELTHVAQQGAARSLSRDAGAGVPSRPAPDPSNHSTIQPKILVKGPRQPIQQSTNATTIHLAGHCGSENDPSAKASCDRFVRFVNFYATAIDNLAKPATPYSSAVAQVHRPLLAAVISSTTARGLYPESAPKNTSVIEVLPNSTVSIPIDGSTDIKVPLPRLKVKIFEKFGAENGYWDSANRAFAFNTAQLPAPMTLDLAQKTIYHETIHMFSDLLSSNAIALTSPSNLDTSRMDQTAWGGSTVERAFVNDVTQIYTSQGASQSDSMVFAQRSWRLIRDEAIARLETVLFERARHGKTRAFSSSDLAEEVRNLSEWIANDAYWAHHIKGASPFQTTSAGRQYITTTLVQMIKAMHLEYIRLRNSNF